MRVAPPVGRGAALLLLPGGERPGAARGGALLHGGVTLRALAPPLEDLSVRAVAVKQPLAQAQGLEAADRVLESSVDGLMVTAPVGDAPDPHVRLGDARAFLQPLRQLQRFASQRVRLLDLALPNRELTVG